MDRDWSQIKTEYVTGTCGVRDLAKKYHVSQDSICRRSKAEGWVEQRKRNQSRVSAELEQKAVERIIDRASKMQTAADLLTDRFLDAITNMDLDNVQALKQVASALKDLREIQGLNRTALDIEEQKARIEALKAKSNMQEEDNGETGIILLPSIDGKLSPPDE